jgi:hypothetical protein
MDLTDSKLVERRKPEQSEPHVGGDQHHLAAETVGKVVFCVV